MQYFPSFFVLLYPRGMFHSMHVAGLCALPAATVSVSGKMLLQNQHRIPKAKKAVLLRNRFRVHTQHLLLTH